MILISDCSCRRLLTLVMNPLAKPVKYFLNHRHDLIIKCSLQNSFYDQKTFIKV